MDVRAYLTERGELVNRYLDENLPGLAEEPVSLHGAMRHLIFPGGKRLRPVLTYAAAEAMGVHPDRVTPFAAAVELIHTYSLVHDDLPCMDDDDERRGYPTVHKVYGEAVAVLAGDALQAEAFSVLLGENGLLSEAGCSATPEAILAAARDLALAAGSRNLVGGQVDDLSFELIGENDEARIESVHARKSAALIAVSITGGARLAGAPEVLLEGFERFGKAVGVAFQIADDLLDADEQEPCSTLRVIGVEAARNRAEALLESALAELEGLGEPAEPLRELARFAVRRDR
jgi:geranylgeranyl diphosphate synthase type II